MRNGYTMMVNLYLLVALAASPGGCAAPRPANARADFDVLSHVDPLIGSANGGNVFAGATLPYGMAKAVADVNGGSNQGGFQLDDGDVTGFSAMHDSGTGGSPSLGLFPLFPHASCADINDCRFPKEARAVAYDRASVVASPGYFALRLAGGVAADMTVSQHAGLFRFRFPDGAEAPTVQLDLSDLSDSRQDNGTVSVDGDTGRMTGSARFVPSFAQGSYAAYFCADFRSGGGAVAIRDSGVYVNTRASADVRELTISRSINGYPLPGGGFVRFHAPGDEPVLARVGVSLMSSEQACAHAEGEIPDWDFDRLRAAAEEAWREKLGAVTVDATGVDPSLVTNFYSGIYRTMVNPQNYTGENPLWESDEPYWDSFYCIWDLWRSQMPFLAIVDPDTLGSQLRSLVDTYRHLGWLPDCRMQLSKGYTQGGSNADNVLADAYLKGVRAGIDWEVAYAAVVKDAEVEPYDWCCEGRGGLDSWKALGYVPEQDFDHRGFGTMTRSVSRTLEYAYNDFCVGALARALGRNADADRYLGRSANWEKLFKPDQKSFLDGAGADTGFVGFFQPRYMNGSWGFQDPLYCSNIDHNATSICSLQRTAGATFESSIWEYSYFVPHAQAELINKFGGPAAFVRRLDYLHDSNITYIGNEPAFLTVFQYHYAGRPGLSARRAHFYVPRSFGTEPAGLPGNDDSGAMGSFVAFAMMGLFPNPGQDVYLIVPPFFPEVRVAVPGGGGRQAVVRAVNFDPTYRDLYVQSARLDGQIYTKSWLTHAFFAGGGVLELTLGRNESDWGTRVEDLPPSLGEYRGFNGSEWRLAGRLAPQRDVYGF